MPLNAPLQTLTATLTRSREKRLRASSNQPILWHRVREPPQIVRNLPMRTNSRDAFQHTFRRLIGPAT